jgi:uncharacterized protein DUF5615
MPWRGAPSTSFGALGGHRQHDASADLEARALDPGHYARDQAGQSVSDERVLPFACLEKRAVLTLNRRHFIRLHGVDAGHTGIVCTFDPDFSGQAGRIHEIVSALAQLDVQLIRINRGVSYLEYVPG